MTAAGRIALNTAVTYLRSLVGIALGLFAVRWILAALGASDFGLFGVVGGLVIVVSLASDVLSGSLTRFFAVAIGRKDDLARWFNVAVAVHWLLPLVLVGAGYPIGAWAIRNWLVIPPDRVDACIWALRLAMASAVAVMAGVPYVSMYRAHQYIAEISFWEMLKVAIMFAGAWMLGSVSGDRLVAYAVLASCAPVAVTLALAARARMRFPFCRIDRRLMFDLARLRELGRFACWEFVACAGDLIRFHGGAFVANKMFGPAVNASYSVSLQVSAHTQGLAAAMIGALTPAVATAEGAGDRRLSTELAFSTCRFGAMLVALFCVPLAVEMDGVLALWLVEPPEWTGAICRCILAALVCHKLGWGHHMLLHATGRIGAYQCTAGCTSALTVALMWALAAAGCGPAGLGIAFVASYSALTVERVLFARWIAGMGVWRWVRTVVVPVGCVVSGSMAVAVWVAGCMAPSMLRIFATSAAAICVTLAGGWFIVCTAVERAFLRRWVGSAIGALRTGADRG